MQNRPLRWWDLTTIFFLALAIFIAATRLVLTEWTENLDGAAYLAAIGLILGLALGYSTFHPRTVAFFTLIYSLFFVPWYLALGMAPSIGWNERIFSLLGRFLFALEQFIINKPVEDPLLFLSSMLLLFWSISISAGYLLTRKGQPWVPLVACGIALFLIEYYVDIYLPEKHSALYIGSFILCTIVLAAQTYYLKTSRRWQKTSVVFESETRADFGRGAFLVALIVLLVAWNIPTVYRILTPGTEERATFNSRWDRFAAQFQNAVAPLSGPALVEVRYTGSSTVLSSGQPLSDAEIFTAETSLPASSSRVYYWRTRSYDNYQAGVWESTVTNVERYSPTGGELPYDDILGRTRVIILMTPRTSMRTIPVPGQAVILSRPVELVMDRLADDTVEINTITIDPTIRAGELFESRVNLAIPTVEELRAAGTNYPQEIKDRYLQLPRSLPERIGTLAEKIAGKETTPYDQAVAITNYLRNEIGYSNNIADIPSGRDPVDWFLFTNKQGFCQYYASAEVLLLRALGVPARYSTGFAQGEPDESRTKFTVREKESHAWPEVYFPGIGWVEFEPTVILTNIAREEGAAINPATGAVQPDGETTDPAADPGDHEKNPASTEKPAGKPSIPTEPVRKTWPVWVLGSVITAGILGGLIFLNRRRLARIPYWLRGKLTSKNRRVPTWLEHLAPDNTPPALTPGLPFPIQLKQLLQKNHIKIPRWLQNWVAWTEMSPLERIFANVSRTLHRLGQEDDDTLTPAERITQLKKILPECQPAADVLLAQFELSTYSPYGGDIQQAREAGKQINRLGIRVWLRDLFGQENPNQPLLKKR